MARNYFIIISLIFCLALPAWGAINDSLELAINCENELDLGEDSSVNGYDMTNADAISQTTGKVGSGSCTGWSSANYLYITDAASPNLDVSQSFSVAAWINNTSSAAVDYLASKRNTTNGEGWEWAKAANGVQILRIEELGQAQISESSDTSFEDTVYHHVGAVYDYTNQEIRFYYDGALDRTISSVSQYDITNTSDFLIGLNGSVGAGPTASTEIDQFLFYSRALVLADFQALYNSGNGTTVPAAASSGFVPRVIISSIDWLSRFFTG